MSSEQPVVVNDQPVMARIRSMMPSYSKASTAIARLLVEDPQAVIRMTISDVAASTGTSVGSVVRFAQDLGLRGFQELKIRIASEARSPFVITPSESQTPAGIASSILRSTADALSEAAVNLNLAILDTVSSRLSAAREVLFLGVGTSSPIAQDTAYRFQSIGLAAQAPIDALLQHVRASLLTSSDVCVAISHTGQTRETLSAVSAAKAAGASTVAVTSYLRSPLTALVDLAVVGGSAETDYQIEAMTSRYVHLSILDSLLAMVVARDPQRAARARELTSNAVTGHRL